MKVSELTELLKANGCHLLKHGSRHDVWRNPSNGRTMLVSRHKSKEVSVGFVISARKLLE